MFDIRINGELIKPVDNEVFSDNYLLESVKPMTSVYYELPKGRRNELSFGVAAATAAKLAFTLEVTDEVK